VKRHQLVEIEWAQFGECLPPPRASVAEYRGRLDAVRGAMDVRGLTHLIVYGDRPPEVLPLSNIPALVPPYSLDPNLVLALEA
jgi:hypothetical protein